MTGNTAQEGSRGEKDGRFDNRHEGSSEKTAGILLKHMLTTPSIPSDTPASVSHLLSHHIADRKPTVLVVEDDARVSAIVCMFLRKFEFNVISAFSGSAGLQQAHEAAPDAIVLDMELPGMTGLEVCCLLKSDPQTSHTPIIFFSGRSDLAGEALAAGADAFLTKPGEVVNLPERLRQVLNKS